MPNGIMELFWGNEFLGLKGLSSRFSFTNILRRVLDETWFNLKSESTGDRTGLFQFTNQPNFFG